MLGVCQPNGSVIHYRGFIQAVNDTAGVNRTVNVVDVENYLRGVLPREVFRQLGQRRWWRRHERAAGLRGRGPNVRALAVAVPVRQDV